MELQKCLETRKSIRKYKETPVSKETIQELIKAAQLAPTWKNSQTGRYYVVMSEEKLTEVKQECLPEFNRKNCADASFFQRNLSFDAFLLGISLDGF